MSDPTAKPPEDAETGSEPTVRGGRGGGRGGGPGPQRGEGMALTLPAGMSDQGFGPTVSSIEGPVVKRAVVPSVEAPTMSSVEAPTVSSVEGDPLIGKTLAERYTLLEPLGSGGMSVVYLARHELLKKVVAVKLLRQEIAGNQASMSRFHREAMAAASIGDPHIVDVTDYGFTDSGEAFLVMERLDGHDLRHVIRSEGALAAGRVVSITRQILQALQAAHARGIVHRDLKAENVFLAERDGHDFVKLLDFGISKALRPVDGTNSTEATGTGVVMGTPQYIAPEQAHGSPNVDHRADLYSLGVILYEMLTSSLPFSGASTLEVIMKHVQEEPQPPRQRRPDADIPASLERVVLRAMKKDPGQRYASAEAMLAALPDPLTLPGGFGSGSLAPGSLAPAPRDRRRSWLLPAAVGGLVVAIGGGWLVPHLVGERHSRRHVRRSPAVAPGPGTTRAGHFGPLAGPVSPPALAPRQAGAADAGSGPGRDRLPALLEQRAVQKKKEARSSPGGKKDSPKTPEELRSNPYRRP